MFFITISKLEAQGCSSEPTANKALGLISSTVRKERTGRAICSVSAAAAEVEARRMKTAMVVICSDKERAAIKPTCDTEICPCPLGSFPISVREAKENSYSLGNQDQTAFLRINLFSENRFFFF